MKNLIIIKIILKVLLLGIGVTLIVYGVLGMNYPNQYEIPPIISYSMLPGLLALIFVENRIKKLEKNNNS